jgi:tryptophan 2,3-dioxygenase
MGKPVYYHDYLDLDRLLSAQHPLSAAEAEAHDEMLFIVVHQAYELWFKLILHELESVIEVFDQEAIRERAMGTLVSRLERINTVQRVMMDQLDVIETMTALDFLDFRELLVPASGFQSLQFRIIENRLGLRPSQRIPIGDNHYSGRFSEEHREALAASEEGPNLHDDVEHWLERTPFLEMGEFAFWEEYRAAVDRMLAKERKAIENNPGVSVEGRAQGMERLDGMETSFANLFDEDRYQASVATGDRRMSRQAFMAALLIHLYRDEPILHLPFRLLTGLVDIDEGFIAWRQRHVLMVLRMIGMRVGTGGTSGYEYLAETTRRSRVFRDLIEVPTFLIPRSELPPLPPSVIEAMRFHFDVA